MMPKMKNKIKWFWNYK